MEKELDGQGDVTVEGNDVTPEETVIEKPGTEKKGEVESEEGKPSEKVEGEPVKKDNTEPEKKEEIDPVQKKINKFYYEKKAAEEKAAEEKRLREAVEAKLAEATKEELPPIPDLPSTMDPDFAKKMEERDELIVLHAHQATKKQALENSRLESQKVEQEATVMAHLETVKACYAKAEEYKIDKQTVNESQDKVGSALLGKQQLCSFLLKGDPLNVLYLSQNTDELDKVSKMPDTEAAVYIATEIAPKAMGLKPKTTKAPEPTYQPSGKGKIENEDPNLEGCTFETGE